MTKVTVFKTRDGQTFECEILAKRHEASLDLMNIMMNLGFRNDGELKRICESIGKNIQDFTAIFTKLKNCSARLAKD